MNRGTLLIILVIGIVGFGGWNLYKQNMKHTASDPLTLYGNVDIRDVSLSFRVPGRVAKMHMEEGDHVKKGQLLSSLDKDTFEKDFAFAKSQIDEAQATYDNAEKTYKRNTALLKSGTVSQSSYDDSFAARDQASAHLKTMQVSLEKSRIALADTELISPSDGIILTRVREEGSIVQTGQSVYTLALDDPVWIRAYIPEDQLGFVYEGQIANICTDSNPDKPYKGWVGFISPQAEFTPKNVETLQLRTDLVYRLRVIVKNPDKGLRQGMPVTINLEPAKGGDGGDGK